MHEINSVIVYVGTASNSWYMLRLIIKLCTLYTLSVRETLNDANKLHLQYNHQPLSVDVVQTGLLMVCNLCRVYKLRKFGVGSIALWFRVYHI